MGGPGGSRPEELSWTAGTVGAPPRSSVDVVERAGTLWPPRAAGWYPGGRLVSSVPGSQKQSADRSVLNTVISSEAKDGVVREAQDH